MTIKNLYYEYRKYFSIHCVTKSSVVVLLFLVFCFGGQTLLNIWGKATEDISAQLEGGLGLAATSEEQPEESHLSETESQKININTANKTELMTLPNIGEKKAEDIIAKREQAAFSSIEDLKEVKGIGEKTFEKLSEAVTV